MIIFVLLFVTLNYVYYKETRSIAIDNAQSKINDLLLNYKAFRTYVSKVQKKEVYRLQDLKQIDSEYFNPRLLSSTYSARNVNEFYNKFRTQNQQKPIKIRFASDNPRNINNKTSKKESSILKQFNTGELTQYTEIIKNGNNTNLYFAIPTKKSNKSCMKCHSTPDIAPKGLIEIYGDKNGFHENIGGIRALLSTTYPLDEDLKSANNTFLLLAFVTFFIFFILLIIVYKFTSKIEHKNEELDNLNKTLDLKVTKRTKELSDEKKYIQKILDTNPDIIIVSNGEHILSANKSFFNFFESESLIEFTKNYDCVCDFFIKLDDNIFPENKLINDIPWCKYIVDDTINIHTVELEYKSELFYFNINAVYLDNNRDILLTFQNTTELKRKDKLLFEQSKMASMGEMIGNIAHQWRQPLSIISTGATGLKVQKEFDNLTDEFFFSTCDLIDENAQYLSKTIDDFRDFIKGDRIKSNFNLKSKVDSFLHLINPSIKSNDINLIININIDVDIDGYPNELIQCLINIFNNAKDALIDSNIEDKYIFIDAISTDKNLIITIKDNAKGIPNDILNKIFEPYFTTKHQSKGTGLGLHMTYNLIVNGMNGDIVASNVKYIYDDKQFEGAEFKITIPV